MGDHGLCGATHLVGGQSQLLLHGERGTHGGRIGVALHQVVDEPLRFLSAQVVSPDQLGENRLPCDLGHDALLGVSSRRVICIRRLIVMACRFVARNLPYCKTSSAPVSGSHLLVRPGQRADNQGRQRGRHRRDAATGVPTETLCSIPRLCRAMDRNRCRVNEIVACVPGLCTDGHRIWRTTHAYID